MLFYSKMMQVAEVLDGTEKEIGSEHDLEQGQVRYLYFWVHPQWSAPYTHSGVNAEIRGYREFVDKLRESPRVGLVQVASSPREDFMGSDVYSRFVEELKQFDEYAEKTLGNRYLIWNYGGFINARNPDSVRALVERYNLLETDQSDFVLEKERWMTRDPKYLAKISVFGKERDTCPLGQATLFGLHNLASVVRYYSQEKPNGIRSPTPTKPFPGDGDSVYIFKSAD